MASSCLIREENGRIAGYALVMGDQLRIRMSGRGTQVSVAVGDGEEMQTYAVACDAQEHAFEWKKGRLAWAHIVPGEMHDAAEVTGQDQVKKGCVLATKKRAVRASTSAQPCKESEVTPRGRYPAISYDIKKEEKTEIACKKSADSDVYTQRAESAQLYLAARSPRWPPPPCWPTARYVDGVWREGGD